MCPASGLDRSLRALQPVVAAVGICLEEAAEACQHALGTISTAGWREVVPDAAVVIGVDPDSTGDALASFCRGHGHGRVVGMDHRSRQHVATQLVADRL